MTDRRNAAITRAELDIRDILQRLDATLAREAIPERVERVMVRRDSYMTVGIRTEEKKRP